MSFITELKRRNVFKVGVAYAIVAWLIMQVAGTFFPALHLPDWTVTFVAVLLLIGFPLALFLAWAYELTPEGIKATTSEGPAQFHARTTGQRLNYFIIGILVLVVVFLVVDNYVLNEDRSQKSEVRMNKAIASANDKGQMTKDQIKPSIAVLPFADMSPGKDQEYFADGIAEELLNSLARISDLEVRGRTSSFYFKNRNEDLHTISKMLNVGYILEGSVRKAGDQVRITAQLINTRTDDHILSKTYDRKLDDIFAIQEDIAQSIAEVLQIALGVGELGRRPGMTRDVAAYNEFLLASAATQNTGNTGEVIFGVIDHLERAVEIDPSFVLAWVGLQNTYQVAATYYPDKAAEYLQKSRDALDRARAIAPDSPFVLFNVAVQNAQNRNWIEADRILEKIPASLLQEIGVVSRINFYAAFLQTLGRPREALAYLEHLRRIDPLAPSVSLSIVEAYSATGDIPAALAEVDRNTTAGPFQGVLRATGIFNALALRDRAEINKRFDQYVATNDAGVPFYTAMVPLLDDPEAAREELRRMAEEARKAPAPLRVFGVAHMAAYFGDPDLALESLRYAAENTPISIGVFSMWRPLFRDVRRLPGFKDLVRDLGLVDYWRTAGKWGDFCHPTGDDDFECE